MGPGVRRVVWPVVRLTGRPPPTARTGELPRRSPISGGQAAESRRGALSGGLGSAKSRRGARGGPRRAEQPSSWRRSAASGRRPPPAARRRGARRPAPGRVARPLPPPRQAAGARPPAAAWSACSPRRGPRRRGANVPVGAASPPAGPPAGHPRFTERSAAACPPRTRRHAALYGGHVAGRYLDTAPARGAKSPLEPALGSRALHSPTAASARRSLGLGQLDVGRVARAACSATRRPALQDQRSRLGARCAGRRVDGQGEVATKERVPYGLTSSRRANAGSASTGRRLEALHAACAGQRPRFRACADVGHQAGARATGRLVPWPPATRARERPMPCPLATRARGRQATRARG